MTGPPLQGRTVLVTGGNAGLGLATAIGLAPTGARVVITARDAARGEAAIATVRERTGVAPEVVALDLASFASIRAAAADVLDRFERLHVLINNAGVALLQRRLTEDGFEATFGVNHLGHFLFTSLLLDRLRASAPARVVVVSSAAHRSVGGLDFDDLQAEQRYRPMLAYGRSKLANIAFTRELARRLDGSGVTANTLHPGFVASRLGRDGDGGALGDVVMTLARPFAISPDRGARTSIYLASSPDVADISGAYFVRCKPHSPSAAARDDVAARRLWEISGSLVASASEPPRPTPDQEA